MKAQMYFDSKTVGGGGVCCANNSIPNNNITNSGDDNGDSKVNTSQKRRVRKCKRVKKIRKNVHVQRNRNNSIGGNGEIKGEMIKEYLCKLQEIVPFSRKDKRLSKLEVITNAIDYIRELRETLGLPPCISYMQFSQQPDFGDVPTTQQIPPLSAPTSTSPSSPSFHSLIPDNFHHFHGNATTKISPVSVAMVAENSESSLEQNFEDTGKESWGDLQPAHWTISVSRNHEIDTTTSAMISSSVSSDLNMST